MLNGGHAAAPVMQAADPTAAIREAYAREQAAANGGAAPAPAPADGVERLVRVDMQKRHARDREDGRLHDRHAIE